MKALQAVLFCVLFVACSVAVFDYIVHDLISGLIMYKEMWRHLF